MEEHARKLAEYVAEEDAVALDNARLSHCVRNATSLVDQLVSHGLEGEAESLSALHRWALDPSHDLMDMEVMSSHVSVLTRRAAKSGVGSPVQEGLQHMEEDLEALRLSRRLRLCKKEDEEARIALELWMGQLGHLAVSDALQGLPEVMWSLSEAETVAAREGPIHALEALREVALSTPDVVLLPVVLARPVAPAAAPPAAPAGPCAHRLVDLGVKLRVGVVDFLLAARSARRAPAHPHLLAPPRAEPEAVVGDFFIQRVALVPDDQPRNVARPELVQHRVHRLDLRLRQGRRDVHHVQKQNWTP